MEKKHPTETKNYTVALLTRALTERSAFALAASLQILV